MNRDQVFERIAEILRDSFGIESGRIALDARLADDLDIDSIDAVDLIVQLKPLLGAALKPEAFKAVRTVGDVVDVVHGMLAGADAPAPASLERQAVEG
jgi:acyl carrier protein